MAFSYWPNTDLQIGPWLTAYVGTFLLEARAAGASVPTDVESAVKVRLTGDLRDPLWVVDTVTGSPRDRRASLQQYLGARVVIASYLRADGAPTDSVETTLLAHSSEMAWEDRLALIELLAARADRVEQARTMLRALWSGVTVAGKRLEFTDSLRGPALFPSHIRPAARLLSTTLALDLSNPLLRVLAETIIQQGAAESRYAWNTQDYGAAVVALSQLVRREQDAPAARIVVRAADGRVLFT